MAGGLIGSLLSVFRGRKSDRETASGQHGSRNGAGGVEAVWTPKGYRIISRQPVSEESGDGADGTVELGRAAYGGTDTSPPRAGYGVGRSYN